MQAKTPIFISKVMALSQAQAAELMPEIQQVTKEPLGK
jgi:hypothetical protein